jgi:hypothetical protein
MKSVGYRTIGTDGHEGIAFGEKAPPGHLRSDIRLAMVERATYPIADHAMR